MSSGYDSSAHPETEDQLDRRRLARQIYALLTDPPAEWSVRVGLFGPWGSGKTTVCHWVAKSAHDNRHLPVWYNPWAVGSSSELWLGFAAKILQVLDEQKIRLRGTQRLQAALRFKRFKELPAKLAEASAVGKALVGAGSVAIEAFLTVGADEIHQIRDKLGERRLIIIIDDLDRADPALLPQLLLSLRELLDLPGFSFLMPFDRTTVIRALEEANPTWNGETFLEKILDFRVQLPEPTATQRQKLFAEEMKRYCPFVPEQAFAELRNLLPSNPRKLKAIVRNVATLRPKAERHDPGEISWQPILYATMLRLESEDFFEHYATETFGDPARNPWIKAHMGAKQAAEEQGRLGRLIDRYAPKDQEIRDRLKLICDDWFNNSSLEDHFKAGYALNLVSNPHAITWGEYRPVYQEWCSTRSLEEVAAWIMKHARERDVSPQAVASELIDTVIMHYGQKLELAAAAFLAAEHQAIMDDAASVREFVRSLLLESVPNISSELLTPANFERLLGIVNTWTQFRANTADKSAREAEKALLLKLVTKPELRLEAFREILYRQHTGFPKGEAWEKFVFDLIRATAKDDTVELLDRLCRDDGIWDLRRSDHHRDTKKLLFDVGSPLWKSPSYEKLQALLKEAAAKPVIQKNAWDWLRLAQLGVQGEIGVEGETIRKFVSAPTTVPPIWNAAICQPLQFRQLKETREIRDVLVTTGAKSADLPIPNWLTVTAEKLGLEPSEKEPPINIAGNDT